MQRGATRYAKRNDIWDMRGLKAEIAQARTHGSPEDKEVETPVVEDQDQKQCGRTCQSKLQNRQPKTHRVLQLTPPRARFTNFLSLRLVYGTARRQGLDVAVSMWDGDSSASIGARGSRDAAPRGEESVWKDDSTTPVRKIVRATEERGATSFRMVGSSERQMLSPLLTTITSLW